MGAQVDIGLSCDTLM